MKYNNECNFKCNFKCNFECKNECKMSAIVSGRLKPNALNVIFALLLHSNNSSLQTLILHSFLHSFFRILRTVLKTNCISVILSLFSLVSLSVERKKGELFQLRLNESLMWTLCYLPFSKSHIFKLNFQFRCVNLKKSSQNCFLIDFSVR